MHITRLSSCNSKEATPITIQIKIMRVNFSLGIGVKYPLKVAVVLLSCLAIFTYELISRLVERQNLKF